MAKPCRRSAAENWSKAAPGDTGRSVCRFIVPFTRGSTTTSRPVMTAMVRATASISALVKLSVIGSPRRGASPAVCASAPPDRAAASRAWIASAMSAGRRPVGEGNFMVSPG